MLESLGVNMDHADVVLLHIELWLLTRLAHMNRNSECEQK